jgi:hypothetical protein
VSNDNKVTVFKERQSLLAKLAKAGPSRDYLAAIGHAESVIADMADSYLGWVEDDLTKINKAQADFKDHLDQPAQYLDKVFQIAHDIKGQGGSFGYDLMTVLGNDLCRFIEGKNTVKKVDLEVIDLYVAAMLTVLSKRLSGDGGLEGNNVLIGLAEVVEKITTGTS